MLKIHSAYIGSIKNWQRFFKDTLAELCQDYVIYPTSITITDINSKFNLPKSYTDFVQAGGIDFINKLLTQLILSDNTEGIFFYPIQQIERFDQKSPDIYHGYLKGWGEDISDPLISDENYYVYHDYKNNLLPDSFFFKLSKFNFIEIGNFDAEYYGLMDLELTIDDEMETWYWSPFDGAVRYRSFAEFMVNYIYDLLLIKNKIRDKTVVDYSSPKLLLDFDRLMV